jgi:hypothetical protein
VANPIRGGGARAVLLLVVGFALVRWPGGTVQVLAVLAGVVAVLLALLELDRLVGLRKAQETQPAARPSGRRLPRQLLPAALAVVVLLPVGIAVAATARPADDTASVSALPPGRWCATATSSSATGRTIR